MLSSYEQVEKKRVDLENLFVLSRTLQAKSGIQRLQAKIKSEITFLDRLLKKPKEIKDEHLRCSNFAYLAAVVSCVEASQNVEEIMKPVSLISENGQEYHMTVDVVSDYGKTWIKVVARNPHALLQSSLGAGGFGRRTLVEQIFDLKECSQLFPYLYQPPSVKIWFAAGVDTKMKHLLDKMNVASVGTVVETPGFICEEQNSDDDRVTDDSDDGQPGLSFETKTKQSSFSCKNDTLVDVLDSPDTIHRHFGQNKGVLTLEEIPHDVKLNLDISTMIAHVSSLTNGGCHFVFQEGILTEQASREREAPVRPHLDSLFEGRELVCCETAHHDFQEILRTVGGLKEKERARQFLKRVTIVPDQPSAKAMALSNSSRVKPRCKIIFGTGDHLKAVTVTANQGFVRAAESQGFQTVSYLHESRALTEMKEETAQSLESEN